jgi:Lrp/AsnC family leucine-responsive transcriptional regulator
MNKPIIKQNSNIEEKILRELQKNCRLSSDEIGKKCGCSRYKVNRIIKKLEENNTIVGYTAVINPTKVNNKYFILLAKRSSIPLDENVLKRLQSSRENNFVENVNVKTIASFYVHGKYDWVAFFTAEDITLAKEFCNKIMKYYNKLLDDLELLEIVAPFRMDGFIIPTDVELKEIIKIF